MGFEVGVHDATDPRRGNSGGDLDESDNSAEPLICFALITGLGGPVSGAAADRVGPSDDPKALGVLPQEEVRLIQFGTWNREAGAASKAGQGHPAKVFGVSLLFALIAAVAYAWLVPAAASATDALVQGLVVGAGVVAASFGINYQFANRSTTMWLIDGGYHTVQFAIYGLVIGLWR